MFAHIEIDESRCKGCGLCTVSCPRNLLEMTESETNSDFQVACIVNEKRCAGCALCASICPDIAIKVFSYRKNIYTGRLSRSFSIYSQVVTSLMT